MNEEEKRRKMDALMSDYVHCIDDDRLEEWPEFFTVDGTYKIISRNNYDQGMPVGVFSAENRAMLVDRVSALRRANIYEPQSYRHLVSSPRFFPPQKGRYPAHTNFLVVRILADGASSLFLSGKYVDQIVFQRGQPKFRERIVVCDSHRFDTLLALPV